MVSQDFFRNDIQKKEGLSYSISYVRCLEVMFFYIKFLKLFSGILHTFYKTNIKQGSSFTLLNDCVDVTKSC